MESQNKITLKVKPRNLYFFFLAVFFFCFILVGVSDAATLYLFPQTLVVFKGDSFVVDVRMDTEGKLINAAEVYLKFPATLRVEGIDQGGSILELWPEQPVFSNEDGGISFTGGIPGGFTGQGKLASIRFSSIQNDSDVPESVVVSFGDNSQTLLNDGNGTKASLSFSSGEYTLIKNPGNLPVVSSRSHPNQNQWYKNNSFQLHWDLIKDAEYSYLLSRDPSAEPDEIPDKPEGNMVWMGDIEYNGLTDGIYYFSLKQRLPGETVWSPKVSFRAMIDTTSPESFKAEISKDSTMFNGRYFLSFSTTDKVSGVDHYEVSEITKKISGGGTEDAYETAVSPYVLKNQKLDDYIKVKAIDKAGNEQVFAIAPVKKPIAYMSLALGVLVIILLLVVLLITLKKFKEKLEKHKKK